MTAFTEDNCVSFAGPCFERARKGNNIGRMDFCSLPYAYLAAAATALAALL